MTTKQENFLSMVHTVNATLKRYEPKWANVKRFVLAATALSDLEATLKVVTADASTDLTGATRDKHLKADEAINHGVNLAKRASIYASLWV